MKILNLHKVGELVYEDREMPEPGEHEVLLKVMACGICSSDESRVMETGTYHFPTVPGHEFAGEVVKLGEGCDEALLGRRASVFPLLPCFKCEACRKKSYATCADYKYFGSRNDGAYAEYLVVPEWNLNLLDDSVPFTVGALSEPAAVAHHAVVMGDVKSGDRVLVIGTGTIGLLIAAFAKEKGAEVFVAGRREESIAFAESFGFKTMHVQTLAAEVDEATDKVRMDVSIEAVGSNQSLADAIMSTRAGGTVVVMGNPKGDETLPKDVYWKILRWQLRLQGTWNSAFKAEEDDWHEVAKVMKAGSFPFERLVTRKYLLSEGEEAFRFLMDKSVHKSRLMFVMHEEAEHLMKERENAESGK